MEELMFLHTSRKLCAVKLAFKSCTLEESCTCTGKVVCVLAKLRAGIKCAEQPPYISGSDFSMLIDSVTYGGCSAHLIPAHNFPSMCATFFEHTPFEC
jgi:hypothetical protein